MPDISELVNRTQAAIQREIDWYTRRADEEKDRFFKNAGIIRAFAFATLVLIVVSVTRLDQVFLSNDKTLIVPVITGVTLLIGAITTWWAGSEDKRGHLRAWTRYRVLIETLKLHQHEVGLALQRLEFALPSQQEDAYAEALTEILSVSRKAKQAVVAETKVWATDASHDLEAYLRELQKVKEAVEATRKHLKLKLGDDDGEKDTKTKKDKGNKDASE